MQMTPADLFTRCGHFLCGPGVGWKEQLATMLQVKTNTVDNWSKGSSRIPPTVWAEIQAFVQDKFSEAPSLIGAIESVRNPEVDPAPDGRQTIVPSGPRRR